MIATAGLAVAIGGIAGCGGHSAHPAAATPVEDHVHGAVAGAGPHNLLVATHYGLEDSANGGRTWRTDGGLGNEMVAGIVKTGATYVASLQMMPGMSMPQLGGGASGGMRMAGMHMATMKMGSSMPDIAFSADGRSWSAPRGLPAGGQVSSMTLGSTPSTVWAALLGKGVYRSTDAGHTWQQVIPAAVPISVIKAVGPNLLMATPSGVFVTSAAGPSMPALAQLDRPVNDLATEPGCRGCVVAALGTGGLAVSHNAGVTWKHQPSPTTFDALYATSTGLFGLVPSTTGGHQGVWRSTDGGHTWKRTLAAPLIDHLYSAAGGKGSTLLAFEWGIKVFRSKNDGRTWTQLSRISPP